MDRDAAGTVERIWITEAGSEPMEAIEGVEAVARRGLRGDRYFRGTGYYSGFDECEVTFIERTALDEIRERFGIDLTDGRHRRNVELRGVDVHDLLERRFGVGEAVFEGTRPRPPCAHVEEVAGEEGVARALKEKRGGICASVVETGTVEVGDEVEVLGSTEADFDALAGAVEERQSDDETD